MQIWILRAVVLSAMCGAAPAQSEVAIYGIADVASMRASGSAAVRVQRIGVGSDARTGFAGKGALGSGLNPLFRSDAGCAGRGGAPFGRLGALSIGVENATAQPASSGTEQAPAAAIGTATSACVTFFDASGNQASASHGARLFPVLPRVTL